MSNFEKLKIWQKAHELTLCIYHLTSKLPKEESFNLTSQMRRAAVSVESNIAEGETCYTTKDKISFFIQSRSSAAEVRTQLRIVSDLYKNISSEALVIYREYETLSMQINSLIRFRRKNSTNE